jgi:DNA-binding CsgD family transcriptional regulator
MFTVALQRMGDQGSHNNLIDGPDIGEAAHQQSWWAFCLPVAQLRRGGVSERNRTMQATQERFLPPLAFALSGSQPPELTPRQRDILGHIAQGRSNKQIAIALGIRERTVKFHIAALFERLGTSSRTEALIVGLRSGVISLDDSF